MNAFNRLFVSLVAIGWIALMIGALVLIWNPGNALEVTSSNLRIGWDIPTANSSEQTLATIVAALLMLPAFMILMAEMSIRDRRADAAVIAGEMQRRNRELEDRNAALAKDLEKERERNADAVRRAADRVEPSGPRRWHLFGR
jgi:hypothetical protein